MNSSYKNDDVIFLLKDVTGLVEPLPSIEREKLIQSGMHYSEMLPIEYIPTEEFLVSLWQMLLLPWQTR